MKQKLEAGLLPVKLSIVDESHLHAGHKFAQESGRTSETHFRVFAVSRAFEGKSLVNRHRLCYSLIQQELKEGGVHAVALTTLTPEEEHKEKEEEEATWWITTVGTCIYFWAFGTSAEDSFLFSNLE